MNMQFGVFLAPFHKAGENPTLALERDLELLGWLDELGYDEAWVGEHHSGGWETIASPEMFLAAAGQRTHRLRLGTGVVSLPYHHPFHVADRITLLDHLTHGRAMLGVGPGALPGDAYFLGIEPTTQRPRMDEALGVIIRLLTEEEPITYKGEWFELRDAQLQLKPLQRPTMPIAVASTISPAGMTAAGKHGIGVLSIASYSEEGLNAMPKQWAYCEEAAAEAKQPPPDRANWRVVAPFHLAESKEQAIEDIQEGLLSWNNDYFIHALGVPNRVPAKSGYELAETMMSAGGAVFGTPDDAIAHLRRLTEITGGFGCFLGLGHEWTTREKTRRSYELMARYVMPEMQDLTSWVRRSQSWTLANKESLMAGTRDAIVKAIKENPDAAASVGLGPKKEEE
ncbi:MAG: LLM class flavin-dependent oxidoreductase [Chloroflexi bacterium]|nr:LLM class flavin-dependent oxidoreductase [Chloroflexota bacterium]